MCDNLDKHPLKGNAYHKFLQRLKRFAKRLNFKSLIEVIIIINSENGFIKCKKCQTNAGFVLLQQKDVFCGQCLHEYCSHKFRSTIGKSKAIRSGERVLVAFSGGINSTAMINMIEEGLNEDQHRKLRFIPSLIFINGNVFSFLRE